MLEMLLWKGPFIIDSFILFWTKVLAIDYQMCEICRNGRFHNDLNNTRDW